MIALALLLAAQTTPVERGVKIPPSDYRALHFDIRNRPATLELAYQVAQGSSPVRLRVVPQVDENRFRAGRSYSELAVTELDFSGRLEVYLQTPGHYVVIVDNRVEKSRGASVRLKGLITYDTLTRPAVELPLWRKSLVIGSSLAVFFGLAWFAGRRLWLANRGQKTHEPPTASS
jgi:hypothetical protein